MGNLLVLPQLVSLDPSLGERVLERSRYLGTLVAGVSWAGTARAPSRERGWCDAFGIVTEDGGLEGPCCPLGSVLVGTESPLQR